MVTLRKGRDVRLKSGGPRMTVEKVNADGTVICSYIYNFQEYRTEAFKVEDLEYAEKFRYYPENLVD
ncbi:MAG: YodC family protein [Candidatus Cyclobacteriaceae bacterium M3_2C_046]